LRQRGNSTPSRPPKKTAAKVRNLQGVGRCARKKAKIKTQIGKNAKEKNARDKNENGKRRTRSAWGQTERVGCTAQCGGFIYLG
jgi:hypothetical protein